MPSSSVRRWLPWLDRRRKDEPVASERRRPRWGERSIEADRIVNEAIERFHKSLNKNLKFSANDVQQEVIFSTFREICTYNVTAGMHRLCRHPTHEAANTGIAPCDEKLCPVMMGKTA